MTYSYTQISQYLRCPGSIATGISMAGGKRKIEASLMFGRCFENGSGCLFLARKMRLQRCSRNGGTYQDAPLEYAKNDSWDRLLSPGDSSARTVRPG